jgi:hypothetical protein
MYPKKIPPPKSTNGGSRKDLKSKSVRRELAWTGGFKTMTGYDQSHEHHEGRDSGSPTEADVGLKLRPHDGVHNPAYYHDEHPSTCRIGENFPIVIRFDSGNFKEM